MEIAVIGREIHLPASFVVGNDHGGKDVPDGWATNLAKSTGGKSYDICLMGIYP
jgi:hypothetical protein